MPSYLVDAVHRFVDKVLKATLEILPCDHGVTQDVDTSKNHIRLAQSLTLVV